VTKKRWAALPRLKPCRAALGFLLSVVSIAESWSARTQVLFLLVIVMTEGWGVCLLEIVSWHASQK
jgi:hypothetical protein